MSPADTSDSAAPSSDTAAPQAPPDVATAGDPEFGIPAIASQPSLFGPIARRLQRRTLIVWCVLCLVGAVPNALAAMTTLEIPTALGVFGWGLWLPGAGFVALGGWWTLVFPLALLVFVLSVVVWVLCGMVVLPPIVWCVAAITAAMIGATEIAWWTWLVVPLLALAIDALHRHLLQRNYQAAIALGLKRAAALPAVIAAFDRVQSPVIPPEMRELTPDDIAGVRYILDRALQPVGQFEGFTRIDNFQLAGLRYQLNYISYGLAMLQRAVLPNFHGYLNQAQRYAIESLTSPEVCGYWKFENLWGNLSLNPDPIATQDDVMLTGLSLIALTSYAENTGDHRYDRDGALQFKPYKHRRDTFGHSTRTFVTSVVNNWAEAIYFLYPCEPHWVFPICNSYAMCGIKPYDRSHGTAFAAQAYPSFMAGLQSEFIAPGGGLQPEMSSLIGISPFWNVTQMQMDNLLSVSQVFNGVHPGYARLWYLLGRHEYLAITPEGLQLTQGSWDSCTDFGNYQRDPGMALGTIALAAREHGDDIIAEAALRKASELLAPVSTPGVLAYADISNTANINLAVARWARRDDWFGIVCRPSPPGARSGPILADCAYPEVLVARAFSDGAALELVLYDGLQSGRYPIRITRLQPGMTYHVAGAEPASLVASADGAATLHVLLDGRTAISIIPASTTAHI